MRGGGGLLSFEIKGGIEPGKAFMNALTLIYRALALAMPKP